MADERVSDPELEDLIQHLQQTHKLDFRGYKRTSLRRRIRQRMEEVGCADFATYRAYVDANAQEFSDLLNTVLINVTSFFRDTDPWTVLSRDIIPQIVERKKEGQPIRIWSVGCASGQEPYSAAMLFAEAMGVEWFCNNVKVYANDLDESALRAARSATYTAREVDGVPPDLLAKYFEHVNSHYVFHRDLRKCVIFGRHNIVNDAPISRIDLLICRNLLIYLDSPTQNTVLPRLHYALNPGGILFLGKAETQLARSKQFEQVDLKSRLFRKVPLEWQRSRGGTLSASPSVTMNHRNSQTRLLEAIVDGSATAYIAVGLDGQVMLANAMARRLLEVGPTDIGKPFHELPVSYRPAELRSRIEEVQATSRALRLENQSYHRPPAESIWLTIDITPIHGDDGKLLATLLGFNNTTRAHQLQTELETTQETLETTVEELQSANEELETTNEELQSTNEELETTNEELQSTNEELETTNEELRSTNEQLESMNDEMRRQSDEATEYRSYAEAVLRSMDTGVIVLDHEMKVRSWNRWSENTWGLRSEEVLGQRLSSVDIGLPVLRLTANIQRVLNGEERQIFIEFRALDRRGRMLDFRVLLLPLLYGSQDARGIVLIMEDMTDLRRSEAFSAYLGRIVAGLMNEVYFLDPETLRFKEVNAGAQRKLGMNMDRIRETTLMDFMPLVPEEDLRAFLTPLMDGKKQEVVFETVLGVKADYSYPAEICMQYLKHEDPPIIVAIVHDTTDRSQLGKVPREMPEESEDEARSAD
ncbi:chemotaxis protein CheR [Skermanella aerolata]|uniref:protein-glutamate O-methyltransferase n=1 Tax=Skermanella aerolata TaxID=393310 RepID=A0A512DQ58_9PROT|nr:CheR family methyltransferase [Skermanella aerolata]KJB92769.1 methyltransferase [Skermanella aerolata KACC 11604]GEO38597.1 chemotaxis protein CheR [Skermanella aerolata]